MISKKKSTATKDSSAKQLWNLGPVSEEKTTQEIKDEMRSGW
ncbi:MAG TPA: hypothetical protein VJH22_06960 [Candidatus Nanoarchaeia archaeon]|nr:hypothetical protein [Candidatus Nanoarchaeia archaeon]